MLNKEYYKRCGVWVGGECGVVCEWSVNVCVCGGGGGVWLSKCGSECVCVCNVVCMK